MEIFAGFLRGSSFFVPLGFVVPSCALDESAPFSGTETSQSPA